MGRASARRTADIPVTVLTGFLGSGKTTLVNRILAGDHGRRIAVIVNEFGELGIDAALISKRSGPVLELSNGCICCATRGNLRQTLGEILTSRTAIDAVLIETSGLADPLPVIEDLENLAQFVNVRLDGVVSVVDAENFDRNLDQADIAYQQIMCADLLLINKVDRSGVDVARQIVESVRQLNVRAAAVACTNCDVPLDVVMGDYGGGPARWSPETRSTGSPQHSHRLFTSAVLDAREPLDEQRLCDWLERLPNSVYRLKGFVRLTDGHPVVVHLVGGRYTVEPVEEDSGITALVAIGQALSPESLQAGLDRCAVAAARDTVRAT